MERERIGISLGSLFPWSAFPLIDSIARIFALPIAAAITRRVGATFWKVEPFKGVTAQGLEKINDIPVLFVEKPGTEMLANTLWEELRVGPYSWWNPTIFPERDTSEERYQEILKLPRVKHITQSLSGVRHEDRVVEVSPEQGKSAAEFVELAQKHNRKRPFVLNTKHLREEGKESPLGPWDKAIEALLPYTDLVRFQPLNREELQRTLNEKELTGLIGILLKLYGRYEGRFVIEVPPYLLGRGYFANPRRMVRILSRVREVIETYAK